jgi:hypothetical protein
MGRNRLLPYKVHSLHFSDAETSSFLNVNKATVDFNLLMLCQVP